VPREGGTEWAAAEPIIINNVMRMRRKIYTYWYDMLSFTAEQLFAKKQSLEGYFSWIEYPSKARDQGGGACRKNLPRPLAEHPSVWFVVNGFIFPSLLPLHIPCPRVIQAAHSLLACLQPVLCGLGTLARLFFFSSAS
jgi:hypothetical protein